MDYFLNFDLPDELIATYPSDLRDGDRMIFFQNNIIHHGVFTNLDFYLQKGDMIVFNNSKVFKARLQIVSLKSDLSSELLLVNQEDSRTWTALIKKAKRFKLGEEFLLSDGKKAKILEILEDGLRRIEFENVFTPDHAQLLGTVPLPPYIIDERKKRGQELYSQQDEERYQTLFAKYYGSVAAPTASLRFSESMIEKLSTKGILFEEITLHVGLGTFKPMDKDPDAFKIHQEKISVSQKTLDRIADVKRQGGRIIAAGTTVARSLETSGYQSFDGWTDIFIKPGFEFKIIDGLITNFHLPNSTLLLLVQAFIGIENTKRIYAEALEQKYRFFSYGDGMILFR